MSKNVIIAEGSIGRRMPDVQKVLTLRPTSGSDLWVPVDERLSRQKYITKNGTYYATEEEIYAFSKVTVNVPGGVQGVTTPTVTTPISNTSPDVTPDIDPYTGLQNNVTVSVEQPDTLTSPTAMPQAIGTSGSSIMGVDPDTGLRSVATVQPDGTLEKKVIPSAIRVLIPPTKTTYRVGEKIQYAGLVVELLDSDGNNFQDDRFPEGIIPWSPVKNLLYPERDLITPKIIASPTSEGGGYSIDVDVGWATEHMRQPIFTSNNLTYNRTYTDYFGEKYEIVTNMSSNDSIIIPTLSKDNVVYFMLFSKSSSGSARTVRHSNPHNDVYEIDTVTEVSGSEHRTYVTNTLFYFNILVSSANPSSFREGELYNYIDINMQYVTLDDTIIESIGTIVFDGKNDTEVPVQWKSPYDGNTYEDKFRIELDGSQSSSSGSSSSEGGSYEGSGGGSF